MTNSMFYCKKKYIKLSFHQNPSKITPDAYEEHDLGDLATKFCSDWMDKWFSNFNRENVKS